MIGEQVVALDRVVAGDEEAEALHQQRAEQRDEGEHHQHLHDGETGGAPRPGNGRLRGRPPSASASGKPNPTHSPACSPRDGFRNMSR